MVSWYFASVYLWPQILCIGIRGILMDIRRELQELEAVLNDTMRVRSQYWVMLLLLTVAIVLCFPALFINNSILGIDEAVGDKPILCGYSGFCILPKTRSISLLLLVLVYRQIISICWMLILLCLLLEYLAGLITII